MIARIRRKKDADSIWVILRSPETGKWYLILEEIMRTTDDTDLIVTEL